MTSFALHPRLAADTTLIGDGPLCRVLLMGDARFPWLVLVPRRPDCREITDLPPADRALLIEEVAAASSALQAITGAEKMNVGAIGNRVAQLHLHVVARFADDAAWPAPVWGHGQPTAYTEAAARDLKRRLRERLGFM